MSKMLIICDNYFDDSDANAICVRNLVSEFIKLNIVIYLITTEEMSKNVESPLKVHYVKRSFYERISNSIGKNHNALFAFISFFRRIINVFIYPNVSPKRTNRIYKIAKRISIQNDIDYFLAIYRPYEGIKCLEKIKKDKINGFYISYHLDNLEDNSFKNRLIKFFLSKKINSSFKNEKKYFDKIIVTPTSVLSGNNVKKMGFPIYKKNELIPFEYHFNKEEINISYIGTIDMHNRNPNFIFSVFNEINKISNKKIHLHIWGKVNGTKLFDFDNELYSFNGSIPNKFVEYVYEESDIVLNIGNQITTKMLPSKIFQIFATGKPIISFNIRKDPSVDYLNAYKKSYIVFYSEKNNIQLISSFINDYSQISNKQSINGAFDDFDPRHIAREILNESK